MEICSKFNSNNLKCTHTSITKIENINYCLRHYKKYIRHLKKENNNIETKYKSKILDYINDAGIIYNSIDFISYYDNIFIYSILIDNDKHILKIQLLETGGIFTLSYEHDLIKLFNSYKLKNNGYFYKPKKYFITIQEPYDYFVKDKLGELNNNEKNKILTDLLLLIKKIHNLDYMYLGLCIDYLIIKKNGTIDLLLYSTATRYLNNIGEVCSNKKIEKLLGDPDFGSINICSYNSGVRKDDIESIIWIKLAMFDNDIIKKISKANSLERISVLKREFLSTRLEIYDNETFSGMLDYNSSLLSILNIN